MKVHFDRQSDAIYFLLDDSRVAESQEVKPGIILDFNEEHQLVGVEILDAGKRIPEASLRKMQFEFG